MSLLFTITAFALALGVLIVVHEFGHYLVARACGVKVLKFSIGFGKALWRYRFSRQGTEWIIALLPLGGYVKMADEREEPVVPEDLDRAFNRQTVWRRMAIVSAGPVANFLLAVALYWALFVYGTQEAKPIVAAPDAGSIAAASGIMRGETILKINGDPVDSWQEVRWRLLHLAVERQSARLEVIDMEHRLNWRVVDLTKFDPEGFEGDPMARVGLKLYRPDVDPVIGKVFPGSVAESAGLLAGDRVLAVDGRTLGTWDDLVREVRGHPGTRLRFQVKRAGELLDIMVQPELVEQNRDRIGRIGASPSIDLRTMQGLVTTVRYGPVTALGLAVARTWETAVFSVSMLGKMVQGRISWKNLSGPVTIADYAGQSAQLGFAAYAGFIALISISLGVLNLLPIPILDGGHLMYYIVEILKGSPVSERAMELGQRLGLTLLLFLMAFAFYNDINRLLSG